MTKCLAEGPGYTITTDEEEREAHSSRCSLAKGHAGVHKAFYAHNADYILLASWDYDQPIREMVCYFCGVEVDEMCFGCGEYVCDECDLRGPFGNHSVEAHR